MARILIPPQARIAGIARLLDSPWDLEALRPGQHRVPGSSSGTSAHRAVFARYTAELQQVIPEARRVWFAILEQTEKHLGDEQAALVEAFRFQPAGAGFDASVVAVVRAHWLACDAINAKLAEAQRLAPQQLLLQWLIDAGEWDAVEVIAGLPYWPIGMDRLGRWI